LLLFTVYRSLHLSDVPGEGGVYFFGVSWSGATFLHLTRYRCRLLLPWWRGDQAADGGDTRRAGLPGGDADDLYFVTQHSAGTGLAAERRFLVCVRSVVLSVCAPGAEAPPRESKNALRVRA